MVLESMRDYSQRQSEGYSLAARAGKQDYGFGVAITSTSRKAKTPIPMPRNQVEASEVNNDKLGREVDPRILFN